MFCGNLKSTIKIFNEVRIYFKAYLSNELRKAVFIQNLLVTYSYRKISMLLSLWRTKMYYY